MVIKMNEVDALCVIAVILFGGFYSVWNILDDINDTLISFKGRRTDDRDDY